MTALLYRRACIVISPRSQTLFGNVIVLETLFRLARPGRSRLQQSCGDKRIPKLELGNEEKGQGGSSAPSLDDN